MSPRTLLALAASLLVLVPAACGRNPAPASDPPPGYASLPDTTVCVVDRTSETGLRELAAKADPAGGVVLLAEGEVQPLERVHPVGLVAGYGGAEPWFSAGEPISFRGHRFVPVESERRVPAELLGRAGEHRGILLFADPGDEPPAEAVYVPVRPGCIFQAYVREDLLSGPGGGG